MPRSPVNFNLSNVRVFEFKIIHFNSTVKLPLGCMCAMSQAQWSCWPMHLPHAEPQELSFRTDVGSGLILPKAHRELDNPAEDGQGEGECG